MFTPKNHLADMLTKGSLTRDEWDHLLRLLHIMNFFFFCSHSLSYRKQSVMSKRAQECTAKEVSAVAKPRPMRLVSRNLLSAKKTPSQDSSALNSPGNQELDQSYVSASVRKQVRNNNQDPTAHSPQRRQDDTLSWSGESASSASTRKSLRGDHSQIERTGLEFHNMQISGHRYLDTVFKNLRLKLNLGAEAPVLNLKTNVLSW